jgi:hypothetical protein
MLRHRTARPAGRALGSSLMHGPLEPESSPGRALRLAADPHSRPGQKPAPDLGRTVGVRGTRVLCPNGGACCGLTKRPLRHSEHARPLSTRNIEELALPIWGSTYAPFLVQSPAGDLACQLEHTQNSGCLLSLSISVLPRQPGGG